MVFIFVFWYIYILVCSTSHNRIPSTRQLKLWKLVFSPFERLEDQGARRVGFWQDVCPWLVDDDFSLCPGMGISLCEQKQRALWCYLLVERTSVPSDYSPTLMISQVALEPCGKEPTCQCRRHKSCMHIQSLGLEDPLEKAMATHSSILA